MSAFGSDEHLRESGYRLISLADISAELVDWLWHGHIPLGMVTGLYGDPGVGKSTVGLDLAARVTTGRPMPDGTPGIGPANVIILSAEDPLAEVIRPRLDAAGADIARASTLTAREPDGTDRPLIIPDDLDLLESAIREKHAMLVLVDVLMAFLSCTVNSYRDQDVRQALALLQAVAERTGAAIIVIGHPTKNRQQSPIYRVGGSIGIIGSYRACFVAAAAPDDPSLLVLAPLKMNLSRMPDAISFRIGDVAGAGLVTWEGISKHTAKSLLSVDGIEGRGESLRDAMTFLADLLRHGPVQATTVEEMAKAEGISMATLRRAKKMLGVVARKFGQPGTSGYWEWSLPPQDAHQELEDAQPAAVSDFEPDERAPGQEPPDWRCFAGPGHKPVLRMDGSTYCGTCHPGSSGTERGLWQ